MKETIGKTNQIKAASCVKLAAATKERGSIAMSDKRKHEASPQTITVDDIIYRLIEDRKHDYDTVIHLQYIAFQHKYHFITECEALAAVLKIYWEW